MGHVVTLRSVEHLRAAMRLADLHTNREVAAATGVSVGVIGGLLAGTKRHVRDETAHALAEGLGQRYAALFTAQHRPRKHPSVAPGPSSPQRDRATDGPHLEAVG